MLFKFNLVSAWQVILVLMLTASANAQADLETVKLHKIKFYEALEAQKTANLMTKTGGQKSSNKRLLSMTEYTALIEEIEEAKKIQKTKTQRQYYLLNTYEVFTVAGKL